jgi:hypothetical protein
VIQAHKGMKVLLDQKEQLVLQVILDLKVILEIPVLLVILGHKEM